MLLEIIKNEEIHSLLRGLFVDLYVKVYVDVKPFRRSKNRSIEGETVIIGGSEKKKEGEEEMEEIVNEEEELG